MTPGIPDHLLVAFLVLAVPRLAVLEYRRLARALEAGRPHARTRAYASTILYQWGFCAVVVGSWIARERPLASLGLGLGAGHGAWLGLGLALAGCGFLVAQTLAVWRQPEARAAVREQLGRLELFLPHNRREGRWFTALSVTAGICEEVVYRGFLMAYLAGWGAPAAIALSSLVFGLSHAYQGRAGAVKAGAIGLVAGGLYWLTGSLWAPMLLHGTADVTGGLMARLSLEGSAAPAPS